MNEIDIGIACTRCDGTGVWRGGFDQLVACEECQGQGYLLTPLGEKLAAFIDQRIERLATMRATEER